MIHPFKKDFSAVYFREIKKPVINSEKIYLNDVLLSKGQGQNNYDIDYTTGIVSLISKLDVSITSISLGVNPVVTTYDAHNYNNGDLIYISNLI